MLQVFDEPAQVLLYHLINNGSPASMAAEAPQPTEVPGMAYYPYMLVPAWCYHPCCLAIKTCSLQKVCLRSAE